MRKLGYVLLIHGPLEIIRIYSVYLRSLPIPIPLSCQDWYQVPWKNLVLVSSYLGVQKLPCIYTHSSAFSTLDIHAEIKNAEMTVFKI